MRETALTSSVLILIIVLLRHVLHGKMAPRLQYALWLLVAVRLLLPGTLFTVPLSVTGALEDLSAVLAENIPAGDAASIFPNNTNTAAVPLPAAPAADVSQTVPETVTGPAGSSDGDRQNQNRLDIVWKIGMAVTGGTILFSNLHLYSCLRKKRRSPALPPEAETGSLPVYLVEDLPSPCLFGLLTPAIYLNQNALSPAYLPYVLTHERTHFRHGDHLWSILRGVCLTVHWYNPLVWLAAALSRQDCELACDDGAIWLLGEGKRLDYGTALLRMISPGRPSLLRASTSMTAGKRNMKERIALIIHRPQMLKITLIAVLLVVCTAVAVTFGRPAEMSGSILDSRPEIIQGEQQDADQQLLFAPMSSGHLSSVEYTHFSGLFCLTLPENWLEDVVYVESEDGVYFYDAESSCWLMTVVPEPAEWVEVYNLTGIHLAEFMFNGDSELAASGSYEPDLFGGSPYIYMLDWNQRPEDAEVNLDKILPLLEQRETLAESFRLLASADSFSQLVYSTYEANMPLAIAYLPYLSWNNYRTVYSENEMLSLLTAVQEFASSGAASWDQYHDIMSSRVDRAIDGVYAEAYENIVQELYLQNPEQFASVFGSQYLTDGERSHMIYWFSRVLAEDRSNASAPAKEELYQILGYME